MYRILYLILILLSTPSFASALSYSIKGLGTLGGNYSVATGINDNGQVVGFSYATQSSANRAFLYDSATGMQDIGTLGGSMSEAYDINNRGQIVGSSYTTSNSDLRAFAYDPATGMREIASSGTSSQAYGINEIGQIVGYNSIGLADGKWHAFLYDPATGFELLTKSGQISSAAFGINDNGQVAGRITTTSGAKTNTAFLYDPVTGFDEITSLGRSWAEDINNSNQMVGAFHVYTDDGGEIHPFYYDESYGMQDIGIFGGNYAKATAINDSGQVVGYSTVLEESGYHAFLYETTNGMQDLNDLVNDNLWSIIKANDINQSGQIVGYGIYDGNHQAFLMTPEIDPVPEPATILLLGSGLAGLAFYRRMKRKTY